MAKSKPEKADEVMNVNSAFIFFRIIDGEYVVGAQGVPLTAERSLAIDDDLIPYGLPIYLQTKLKMPINQLLLTILNDCSRYWIGN